MLWSTAPRGVCESKMARKGGAFQHTCDLLNRYLKEKGTLGLSLSLDPRPKGETEPRTMNLLPGLEEPSPSAQMTIFYGGKVMVFENFPPESAREVMAMAGRLRPASAAAAATDIPVSSDLPIARRVSLNRFLEKRKDRISSRAPYQAPASSSSSASSLSATRKEEVMQPWLGLAPVSPSDLSEVL